MKQKIYVHIEASIPVDGMDVENLPKEVRDFLDAIGPRDDADLECWFTKNNEYKPCKLKE